MKPLSILPSILVLVIGCSSPSICALSDCVGSGGDLMRMVGGGGEDMATNDSFGTSDDLVDTMMDEAVVADLAPRIPPGDLNGCLRTLSGVGMADFTIAFDLALAANAIGQPATLLTQRATCDNLGSYWYIGIKPNGGIYAVLGSPYVGIDAAGLIVDSLVHHVAVMRQGGDYSIVLDGKMTASGMTTTTLGTLPPIEVGMSTACKTTPTPGVLIENVCLTVP